MRSNLEPVTGDHDPYVPLVILENAFRYWWIVALLVVLGGLVGLRVHSIKPPLYEAKAQYSIAIDYASTGALTQYDQDLAINRAGNIFMSTELLQRVVDQANREGLNITLDELRKIIAIERQFSVWNIRVRDPDPVVAKHLAMIWIDQGEEILQQSYQNAIQAYRLERYIQSQENCLERYGTKNSSDMLCMGGSFADIQKNLEDAGAALYQERQASRGLFAGLTFGPFDQPVLSQQPVTPDRGQYVLLGGLFGLLLAVGFVEFGTPMLRRMRS